MIKEWTLKEEQLLRDHFLNSTFDDILKLFPHYTLEQILKKAIELDLL